jgi:hypothetical protein
MEMINENEEQVKKEPKTPLYIRQAVLKYQAANKEKMNEKARRFREAHKDDEEYLERSRVYQREYKRKLKEKSLAEKKQNGETETLVEIKYCPCCNKKVGKNKKLKCI